MLYFSSFFHFECDVCWLMSASCLAWWITLPSLCPEQHLEKSSVLIKLTLFHRFRTSDGSFLALLWSYFWQGCQNCIALVRTSILRKLLFWKSFHFFHQFWFSGEEISTFRQNFCPRIVRSAFFTFGVHSNILWEKKFQRHEFVLSFWVFRDRFFGFLAKTFLQGYESCI